MPWHPVQHVNARRLSHAGAEAILLKRERGPGTFLFRESMDGTVALALWDGLRVHHLDIHDHDEVMTPDYFT